MSTPNHETPSGHQPAQANDILYSSLNNLLDAALDLDLAQKNLIHDLTGLSSKLSNSQDRAGRIQGIIDSLRGAYSSKKIVKETCKLCAEIESSRLKNSDPGRLKDIQTALERSRESVEELEGKITCMLRNQILVPAEVEGVLIASTSVVSNLQICSLFMVQLTRDMETAKEELRGKEQEISTLNKLVEGMTVEKEGLAKANDNNIYLISRLNQRIEEMTALTNDVIKEHGVVVDEKNAEIEALQIENASLVIAFYEMLSLHEVEIEQLCDFVDFLLAEREGMIRGHEEEVQRLIDQISAYSAIMDSKVGSLEATKRDLENNVSFLQTQNRFLNEDLADARNDLGRMRGAAYKAATAAGRNMGAMGGATWGVYIGGTLGGPVGAAVGGCLGSAFGGLVGWREGSRNAGNCINETNVPKRRSS